MFIETEDGKLVNLNGCIMVAYQRLDDFVDNKLYKKESGIYALYAGGTEILLFSHEVFDMYLVHGLEDKIDKFISTQIILRINELIIDHAKTGSAVITGEEIFMPFLQAYPEFEPAILKMSRSLSDRWMSYIELIERWG